MASSAVYHLFKDMGAYYSNLLLKFDQLGIITVTFLQAFIGIQLAFSKYRTFGDVMFVIVMIMFIVNIALMTLPCSAHAECYSVKVASIIVMISFLFCVFMAWYFLVASKEEIDLFFYKMLLSYCMLGIAFGFYRTRVPERFSASAEILLKYRWHIETFFQSHVIWHLLITAQ